MVQDALISNQTDKKYVIMYRLYAFNEEKKMLC